MDDNLSPHFKMKFTGMDTFYAEDGNITKNQKISIETPTLRTQPTKVLGIDYIGVSKVGKEKNRGIFIPLVERPNSAQKQQLFKPKMPTQPQQKQNRFKSLNYAPIEKKVSTTQSFENSQRELSKQRSQKVNLSVMRTPASKPKNLIPQKLPEIRVSQRLSPLKHEPIESYGLERSTSGKILDSPQIKQSPVSHKLLSLAQTRKQSESDKVGRKIIIGIDTVDEYQVIEKTITEQTQQYDVAAPTKLLKQQQEVLVVTSKPKQKDNQQRVEHLIKNRTYESHNALMNDYLKRMNLPDQSKVFSFNSQDEHIRRFLLRHKWIENTHPGTQVYDLKWSYTDSVDEVNNLIEGQYYNHFRSSRELTSKNGLITNFKNNSEYGLDPFQFFPRSYDLGNAAEREDFQIEYEKTTFCIILKKHIKYLKMRRPQFVSQLRKEIQQEDAKKIIRTNLEARRLILSKELNRKFKTIYKSEDLQNYDEEKDLKLNLHLLCDVISRFSDWKHQISGFFEELETDVNTKQQQKLKECLCHYSRCDINYDKLELKEYQKTLLINNQRFQTPNRKLIKKLIKYHYFFKVNEPSYINDGVENLWIVKPSGNARGQGIYLEKNIDEAIDQGKGMQARIIQKYLERPLIFHTQDKQYKSINGKKFDIRQWVLVRSFTPLRVYMFSQCYMRMCSQTYDLKDYKNPYKHLTNYSLNKNNFESNNESVFSSQAMEELLLKCHGVSWEDQIKPHVSDLILDTVKSMQEQFEGEPKNCFELYGFDIILDKKWKPWLLEVNLSPACAERVSWLTEMLNYMTESMFRILLPPNYYSIPDFLPTQDKYYWEPLQVDEIAQPQIKMQQEVYFQVLGTKINCAKERKAENQYDRLLYTLMHNNKSYTCLVKVCKNVSCKKLINLFKKDKMCDNILKIWTNVSMHQRKNQTQIKQMCFDYIMPCQMLHRHQKKDISKRDKMRFKDLGQLQGSSSSKYQKILDLRKSRTLHIAIILGLKGSKSLSSKKEVFQISRFHSEVVASCVQNPYQACHCDTKTYQKVKVIFQYRYQQQKQYCLLLKKIKYVTKLQSYVRKKLAHKISSLLIRERASLYLQSCIRTKFKQITFKKLKISDGLTQMIRVVNGFKMMQAIHRIQINGNVREVAALKIQGIRHIRLAIRYLKRLKKLKLLIKLQSMIKMHLCRKRYRRMIKRRRMMKIIIKAIRAYIFRKNIYQRIQTSNDKKVRSTLDINKTLNSFQTLQSTNSTQKINQSSSKFSTNELAKSVQQRKLQQKPNQQQQQLLQKILNDDLSEYYNQDSLKTLKKAKPPMRPVKR